jgi:hypothetical protein
VKERDLIAFGIVQSVLQDRLQQWKFTRLRLNKRGPLCDKNATTVFLVNTRSVAADRTGEIDTSLPLQPSHERVKGTVAGTLDRPPGNPVHFTMASELRFALRHPDTAPVLDKIFFPGYVIPRIDIRLTADT